MHISSYGKVLLKDIQLSFSLILRISDSIYNYLYYMTSLCRSKHWSFKE